MKERLGLYLVEPYTVGMDTVYDANLTPGSMTDGIEVLNRIGSTMEYPTLGNTKFIVFRPEIRLLVSDERGQVGIQDIFAGVRANAFGWVPDIYRFSGVPTSIDYEFGGTRKPEMGSCR